MTAPVSGDGELVTRALSGESAAFGELYNRYFPSVYDFLHRTLQDAEAAAYVTQETFLRAMRSLASLAKPAAFKSWLLSIAYGQAMNRIEQRKRPAPPSPASRAYSESDGLLQQVDVDRLADPAQAAEMQETARLVWEAATILDRRAYAVLDLHARQGLESAEIAEVLGVSKGSAYTMLSRMMRSVEEVIGAYLLMRRGVERCPALQRIVGRFSIPPLTQEMCRTVDRHVEDCAVCEETHRSLLAPLALFGALAVVPPAAGIRERIWKNLETQWTQPGRLSVQKARLGKSLSILARKTETAERGSSQSIGGRDLFVVLGAVLVLAALPVIAIFSISVSGSGSNSDSPSVSPLYATATKRPPTATRTVGPTAEATAARTPTAAQTWEPPTIAPVAPATQHPRSTPPTRPTTGPVPPTLPPAPTTPAGPTAKPTATPHPTNTPWATPPPLPQ